MYLLTNPGSQVWVWVVLGLSVVVFLATGFNLFLRGTAVSKAKRESSKNRFLIGLLTMILSGLVGVLSANSIFLEHEEEEEEEVAQSGEVEEEILEKAPFAIVTNEQELNLNTTRPVVGVTATGRIVPCTAQVYDDREDFVTGGALYCMWSEAIQLTEGFTPNALIAILDASELTYLSIDDPISQEQTDCLSTDPQIDLKMEGKLDGEIYPLSVSCSNGEIPHRLALVDEAPQSGQQSG